MLDSLDPPAPAHPESASTLDETSQSLDALERELTALAALQRRAEHAVRPRAS